MSTSDIRRLVERLEADVNNGGFNQYFFNSAGDDAAAAIEALTTIGASETAALLKAACGRFPGGAPPADRFARQEELEGVDPDGDAFEELDQAFFAYPDNLADLLAAYDASTA